MEGAAGRVGYEYNYQFSFDNDILSNTDEYTLYPGVKNLIFQIRTNFIIKKNKTSDDSNDDGDEIIDSEKFNAVLRGEEERYFLFFYTWYRFEQYWMTFDETLQLTREAVDFAQSQPSDLNPVPIAVSLDVCTVQQEGENIEATRERAITSKHLVPLYLWPFTRKRNTKPPHGPHLMAFLMTLERIRVVNIEEGLATMKVCSICSKAPTIGAHISRIDCGHVFHSHCIVGLLEHDNLCPTCCFPAYDSYLRILV